ncbi:MAG: pyruvate carboxylase subunit B [Candidatus Dormibacteraeota bacterium]|nr:pyruvate carboxylase subunit B [Candidatus Dormibacteraeota bacterium]
MPRLELVETSLRHGQQSLLVSRLRQRHALPVAAKLDSCGFAALDVFGGATFEASLRFLAEDPFERLRAIRRAAPITPLLAWLAGQALVAHRHMPDDVVDSFIAAAAGDGIDIFRCYDPLNDVRNLTRPAAAVASAGKQAEGVIVYSDAPSHDLESIVRVGRQLVEAGFPSVCLHDPLGVLIASRASETVRALREALNVPVSVSIAAQTGQATLVSYSAALAGAQRIDVAISPLAGGASMPAAEAVVAGFAGTDADPGLDLEAVAAAALELEGSLTLYADVIDPLSARLDTSALRGLLPPSAMGHALAELRDRDALGSLREVEEEVSRVRRELGSPPLVSPLTEIIATQAVYNVVDGDRYATISQEIKDYCLGLYGAPPQPVDPEIRRLVNGREEAITCRPADLLEPALPAARRDLRREGVASPDDEAVVTFAMFPVPYLALARGEAVAETLGDEPARSVEASAAPEDAGAVDAAGDEGAAPEPPAQPVRELTVEVDGQSYSVRVIGAGITVDGGAVAQPSSSPADGPVVVREGTVVAPMQGLLLKVSVKVGDKVNLGDVVAVLEAMKMQNDITATRTGVVASVFAKEGQVVGPREPLLHIDEGPG